ncbi:hypothetical protein IGL98_000431 [Enterococcus sp. DIV0840]|uniref:hypothetical protein n=1 Tax=unclassified Enterococcus TaxID=2608891 RepID=UPI001A903E99|nr:hypothetical protein [Enterococcus sp. DIV0849a]MBO0435564.1 hypothetical protein [Enterococcus sp. DIV0849a]
MKAYNYQFTQFISKSLVTFDDYQEEEEFTLFCTQLSKERFPKKNERDKILNDWIAFFENNPEKIKKLHVTGRMNQKLFNAICTQKNLEELYIKWGVYPDLTPIKQLKNLRYLSLCAGASAKDISPVSSLTKLEVLILKTVGVIDYSSFRILHNLQQLGIHSGMDNLVKVESLEFLKNLPQLKNFRTTGFRLLNHDYSPILSLKNLEFLSVNMPAYDHKIWNDQLATHFSHISENKHQIFYS